jgi:hypothetical protein
MKGSPTKKAGAAANANAHLPSRKKLMKDSFEWTEEAIMAVHETSNPDNESKSPTASTAPNKPHPSSAKDKDKPPPPILGVPIGQKVDSGLYVDTMEAKIERVQQRKRDEAQRAARRAALPPPPVPTNHALGEYQLHHLAPMKAAQAAAASAAAFLTDYFARFVAERPHLLDGVAATFPLHLFDDATYDELLPVPDLAEGVDEEVAFAALPAVCLVSPFVLAGASAADGSGLGSEMDGLALDDPSSSLARGAGTWHPCKVVKALPPPPPSTLSWEELGAAGKNAGLQYVVRVVEGSPTASESGETKGDADADADGVPEEKHAGAAGSLVGRVFTVSSLHVHILRPPRQAGPPSPSKPPKGLRAVAAPATKPPTPPLQIYGDRVVQALERRATCLGLIKGLYYVHSMPYNEGTPPPPIPPSYEPVFTSSPRNGWQRWRRRCRSSRWTASKCAA